MTVLKFLSQNPNTCVISVLVFADLLFPCKLEFSGFFISRDILDRLGWFHSYFRLLGIHNITPQIGGRELKQ